MSKSKVSKKVIADPDVESDLAKEVVESPESSEPVESSEVKSDYANHPKFAKFKKSGE